MSLRDNLLIRLLITARDNASDKLKAITASVRGLVVQVVAWAAAFLSLKGAVDAAEALEVQMGKLRGAIAATGGAAGLTAEEIDTMARNLDEATLGGAANIRDAAAQLLTFKSVGRDVFERTLKAAQDLSSTGFGSVEQAAVQLGKALEDPLVGLGALTRVGVSFNAQQKAQIEDFVKLGQVAEAQKVILAAVEGQVQGVAAAAGAGRRGGFGRQAFHGPQGNGGRVADRGLGPAQSTTRRFSGLGEPGGDRCRPGIAGYFCRDRDRRDRAGRSASQRDRHPWRFRWRGGDDGLLATKSSACRL